jgi:Fe2+ or Zn2+ uptake regulation protein
MTYYNTNKEGGQTLKDSQVKAATQDEVILDLFTNNPNYLYTANDVHRITGLNCPITSVRRSVTGLYKKGKIIKTEVMRYGGYGKETHCYTLNKNDGQGVLF